SLRPAIWFARPPGESSHSNLELPPSPEGCECPAAISQGAGRPAVGQLVQCYSRSLRPRQQRECLFPRTLVDHLCDIDRPRQGAGIHQLFLHEFELVDREWKIAANDVGPD